MAVTSSGYYGLTVAELLNPEQIWAGWTDPLHEWHKRDWNSTPQRGRALKYKGWKLFEHGLHPGAMVEMSVQRAVMP